MVELDLAKFVLQYAHSNKAEDKSPKTVTWYTEMPTAFTNFLKSAGINASLGDFNVTSARELLIHEQARGLSPHTLQDKVRSLKAFSSWLFTERYTPENLLAILKLPRTPIKIIEPLTTVEIDKLIGIQNPLMAIGSRNPSLPLPYYRDYIVSDNRHNRCQLFYGHYIEHLASDSTSAKAIIPVFHQKFGKDGLKSRPKPCFDEPGLRPQSIYPFIDMPGQV